MTFQQLIESMICVDIISWFLWLFNPLMLGDNKSRAHLNKSAGFNRRFV